MTNLPPAAVLAARLEHQLQTLHLLVASLRPALLEDVSKAQQILAQLQEAMK